MPFKNGEVMPYGPSGQALAVEGATKKHKKARKMKKGKLGKMGKMGKGKRGRKPGKPTFDNAGEGRY